MQVKSIAECSPQVKCIAELLPQVKGEHSAIFLTLGSILKKGSILQYFWP